VRGDARVVTGYAPHQNQTPTTKTPPQPPHPTHRTCVERADWGTLTGDSLLDMGSMVLRNATLTVSVWAITHYGLRI